MDTTIRGDHVDHVDGIESKFENQIVFCKMAVC